MLVSMFGRETISLCQIGKLRIVPMSIRYILVRRLKYILRPKEVLSCSNTNTSRSWVEIIAVEVKESSKSKGRDGEIMNRK